MSKFMKTTVFLMIITMFSKVLGFAREQVLAYVYGTGINAEAYITSMSIPSVIFAAIGTAIVTTVIPLYIEINRNEGEKRSLDFVNNTMNITIIVSIIIACFVYIFAEPVVKIFAMDFDGQKLFLTVTFLRIIIFGIIFMGLSNIMTAFLQANDNFIIPGSVAIPYNIIIILFIILSSKMDVKLMAIGAAIAMASQVMWQLPFAIKKGYAYKLNISLKDKYVKKMFALLGPIFIGGAVTQINTIVDRSIASTLGDGIIPALNYASRLDGFVQGLFVISICTVIYPKLSKLGIEKDNENMALVISKSVNTIICLIIPISVGAIILSKPLVKLIFERGAFDSHSTQLTAVALSLYSLGTVAVGIRDVLSKVFYSLQDTKTPMINGTIAIVINIILNIVLAKAIGYPGLPLATSISVIICTSLLFISLKKKIGNFGQGKILKTSVKVIIAVFIMAIVTSTTHKYLNVVLGIGLINEVINILVSVLVGASIYGIGIILLKVEEVSAIIDLIKTKLKKKNYKEENYEDCIYN